MQTLYIFFCRPLGLCALRIEVCALSLVCVRTYSGKEDAAVFARAARYGSMTVWLGIARVCCPTVLVL